MPPPGWLGVAILAFTCTLTACPSSAWPGSPPSGSPTNGRYDVAEHGLDPSGKTDNTDRLQALSRSIPPRGGIVHFPAGDWTILRDWFVADNVMIETDAGARFPNGLHVNVDSDTAILARHAALQGLAGLSATDAPGFTLYTSLMVPQTAGAISYEKAALYASASSYDASPHEVGVSADAIRTSKDIVGIVGSATILPGNNGGSASGIHAAASVSPGADGQASAIEADLSNNGRAQPENSRFDTKNGILSVSSGTRAGTSAFLVNSFHPDGWYDGYVALRRSISRYAFALRDLAIYPQASPLFFVDSAGNIFGQSLSTATSSLRASADGELDLGLRETEGRPQINFNGNGVGGGYSVRVMANAAGSLIMQSRTGLADLTAGHVTMRGATAAGHPVMTIVAVPGTASSPCILGQMAIDRDYLYSCVSVDRWRRIRQSSW